MWVVWRRSLSSKQDTAHSVSNVKWKLKQLQETGHFQRLSYKEVQQRKERAKKNAKASFSDGISPQKVLLLLKSRYDGAIIPDVQGKPIDLHTLSPNNLRVNDPKSFQLLKGLMQLKNIEKRNIDSRIIMALTGVTRASLRDSYFVTKDVLHLLEQDNDITRAMEVCRLANTEASVGINMILEWCLKRSRKDLAEKVLSNRSRWGIPLSPATYVTYFSGLSNCHEWGSVTDDLANKVIKRFKEDKITRNVETFNAALKLLMKNFNNDQALAWEFFEKLGVVKLDPDAQTFTIFLQGLKTLYQTKVRQVQKDSSISSQERTKKLFELQAILIQRANLVLEQAMIYATPPVPPSEDQVKENPHLLMSYKKKIKHPMLDIDRHFAVAFLSCYCEPSAGTSWSNKSGSHYWYLQSVITYLQAWMPEVGSLVKFITSTSTGKNLKRSDTEELIVVAPSQEIKRKTDLRTESAELPDEVLPQNVIKRKTMNELNPWAEFPPPPLSHRKDKHFFTGINRQVIDFARIKASDLHKEYLEEQARRKQRSRFPWKKRTVLRTEKQGINKFLLRILLDSLLRLGLYEEFYKAMWLSISVWGDIKFDHSRLRKGEPLQARAISEDMYPVIESLSGKKTDVGFCRSDAQLDVIDIGLVEDFIHKIEEHMPRSSNPSGFAVEVLAVFSNRKINREKELSPRPSTFNAIFAMLNRDIYRYNDRNVTLGYQINKRKNLANNTAKSSMTFSQLNDLLDSLDILVRSIFARFGGKSMDGLFLQSYNNLVSRIYSTTWDGAPESHENAITIHKKLIRSGILMYRPNHLIDRRQDHTYSELIIKSMNFVHDKLKDRNDLSKNEVDLMMNLRNLLQLEKTKEDSESKYEALQMSVYRLTEKSNLSKKANNDSVTPPEKHIQEKEVHENESPKEPSVL
ncbi:hypothetical protein JCM33374_g3428 [Metschnikowia sp. JCM 33374]|nr:hypothetical protein JCM33374_g3428 [Metschnikowia sp. JCM 33374]